MRQMSATGCSDVGGDDEDGGRCKERVGRKVFEPRRGSILVQKSGRNSALSDSLETKVPHADTDAWLRDPDTPALLSHPPDSLS